MDTYEHDSRDRPTSAASSPSSTKGPLKLAAAGWPLCNPLRTTGCSNSLFSTNFHPPTSLRTSTLHTTTPTALRTNMLPSRYLPAVILPLFYLLSTSTPSFALHASEAGVIDWHKTQIGVPLIFSQSLSPTFHRVTQKNANEYGVALNDTTQSVVLTATSANVLAALEPLKGDVGTLLSFCEMHNSFSDSYDDSSVEISIRALRPDCKL